MNSLPKFDAALTGFESFARSSGAPTELWFVEAEDVALMGRFLTLKRTAQSERRDSARQRYEAAAKEVPGVEIVGIASIGTTGLVCLVYRPRNRRDALERMIPRDVKYSLRTPLLEARVAGRIFWCLVSWRARKDASLQEWRRTTFGQAS